MKIYTFGAEDAPEQWAHLVKSVALGAIERRWSCVLF